MPGAHRLPLRLWIIVVLLVAIAPPSGLMVAELVNDHARALAAAAPEPDPWTGAFGSGTGLPEGSADAARQAQGRSRVQADARLRHGLLIMALIVVPAAAIGFLLLDRLVARPVMRLAALADRLSRGETPEPAPDRSSSVRELDRLGDALEATALQAARGRADAEAIRAEYRKRAESDAVTGLANRHSFDNALAQAIAAADKGGLPFALFMIDVDHFKLVNDRFGHEAGDELLRCIARRLEGAVRETDLVARIAGDEFTVLLRDRVVELGIADQVAERIVRGVAGPVRLGPALFVPRVSVGYAIHPEDGEGIGPLAAADAALYAAKRGGRGQWQRWTPALGREPGQPRASTMIA